MMVMVLVVLMMTFSCVKANRYVSTTLIGKSTTGSHGKICSEILCPVSNTTYTPHIIRMLLVLKENVMSMLW